MFTATLRQSLSSVHAASIVVCAAGLVSCASNDTGPVHATFSPSSPDGPAQTDLSAVRSTSADHNALLPVRVRIHPLTRLERSPDAAAATAPDATAWQIACHIELSDAYGHTTKGLGRLRIELYRPRSDRADGPETQDAVWNIDLRDPKENAGVYDDLVTRTYTVYLASLPRWLEDWASLSAQRRADTNSPIGDDSDFVTIKAYFITDRNGRERVYENTYRMPG